MKQGTPQTIEEAIGRSEISGVKLSTQRQFELRGLIKDFLAQKFSIATLQEMPAMDLWFILFPEDKVLYTESKGGSDGIEAPNRTHLGCSDRFNRGQGKTFTRID
jgi:hypothetical protein